MDGHRDVAERPLIVVTILVSIVAIVVPFSAFAYIAYRIGRRTQRAIDSFAVSVNERLRKNLTTLNAQLTEIHTLVNSDMTAARQELLDQTEITLMMLRRVVEEARREGIEPDPDDVAAVVKTERRVKAMRGVLADRLAQQLVVEAQQRDARAAQDDLTDDDGSP